MKHPGPFSRRAHAFQCKHCGATVVDTTLTSEPNKRCSCLITDTRVKPGGSVTIGCRKCGNDVEIGVIELSRLHHPPLCENCSESTEAICDTEK